MPYNHTVWAPEVATFLHTGDIGTVFRRYPEPWKVFIEDADLQVRALLHVVGADARLTTKACRCACLRPTSTAIGILFTGPLQAGSRAGLSACRRGFGHHHPGVQQTWFAIVHIKCRWHAVLRLALLDCAALYCRMRWEQTRPVMRAARVWGSRWFGPSARCSALPSR
jgi:hypothetical protein